MKDNIKRGFRELGSEAVDWGRFTRDRVSRIYVQDNEYFTTCMQTFQRQLSNCHALYPFTRE